MRARPLRRQPVITGLGIVSPIGIGIEKFWPAALAGRSGLGTPTLFDASKLPPECRIVGEVKGFDPLKWMPARSARMAGRFSQFAVAAAKMAIQDSGLDFDSIPPERASVAYGTSLNGQPDLGETNLAAFLSGRDVWPWTTLEYPGHASTSHVAIAARIQGQATTFATACAAGLDAIGWASNEIRDARADAIIAGGTDAPLSEYVLTLFNAVGVLSKWPGPPEEASRPFDRLRSGLVLAEGAATVLLEDEQSARTRGVPIYARVLGYASINEAEHLRKIDEEGEAIARAIAVALRRAELSARDIDLVCAHGNSMPDYDAAETAGIKKALGSHSWNTPLSSLKSMCGQSLAAGSAMQVVGACLAIRDQSVSPTINYRVPDPDCDLDYVPNTARAVRVRTALVHAHSLGGSHAVMILGAPD